MGSTSFFVLEQTRGWWRTCTWMVATIHVYGRHQTGKMHYKTDDMILGSYVLSPQLSLMSNSCKIQSSGIGLPKFIPYLLKITGIT